MSTNKVEDLDNDLKELRVWNSAIADTKALLPRLLREDASKWGEQPYSTWSQQVIQSLDYFQEDPQLLDPHLVDILPPVISRYLDVVQSKRFLNHDPLVQNCANKLSVMLYTLCKVRGRKVVSRFLNNEPRYLDPLLRALHTVSPSAGSVEDEDPFSKNWQQCFVLVLWLGHLILTPFDLSTISSGDLETKELRGLKLPSRLPSIAVHALKVGINAVRSSSRAQSIGAELLARLALRPDMQKLRVLESLLEWASLGIQNSNDAIRIHHCLGLLAFVNGIIVSAHVQPIAKFIPRLFDQVNGIFNADKTTKYGQINSSAVAKKFAVKIQRNIVVQLLQAEYASDEDSRSVSNKMLQEREAVEDVIDFLLSSLADRDTQVRLAASKGLSVIAQKLGPEQAEEVVEAVLGSLNEDTFTKEDGNRSLEAVNPVRWHGLTLTLAHLLFRRSASAAQLPDILEALYLALVFEQKSTTGNSIGGNVRDAANFGLWSLARRFSTAQIEASYPDTASIFREKAEPLERRRVSPVQRTANVLVTSACLDPIGNVRRGSSAALQELIGRHPNVIHNGISLIQVVDYHAVGLRSRASEDVSILAAKLGINYEKALLHHIHDWRGIFAADEASRNNAATALGRLTSLQSHEKTMKLMRSTLSELQLTHHNDIVTRHGLISALAAVARKRAEMLQEGKYIAQQAVSSDFLFLEYFWHNSELSLTLPSKEFRHTLAEVEMTAAAILSLGCEMARYAVHYNLLRANSCNPQEFQLPHTAYAFFTECLKKINIEGRNLTIDACEQLCRRLLAPEGCSKLADQWIKELKYAPRPSKVPGLQVGLGCMWSILLEDPADNSNASRADEILTVLLTNCSHEAGIEARVVGLRSLMSIVDSKVLGQDSRRQQWEQKILHSICMALNDYTINERGDVGSLVRIEGLSLLEHLWSNRFRNTTVEHSLEFECYCQVACLALEKLDKVRLHAAHCLYHSPYWNAAGGLPSSLADVGTYEYFFELLCHLTTFTDAEAPIKQAGTAPIEEIGRSDRETALNFVFRGISNSAGGGSDSIMQIARSALLDFIDILTTQTDNSSDERNHLNLNHFIGKSLVKNFEWSLSLNIDDRDRIQLPLLSLASFLLDMDVLQRLPSNQFKWRTLLSLVQKSHFKSTSIPKLLLALDVYRGLAGTSFGFSNGWIPESVRSEARAKVVNMMEKHPYAKVRTRAVEVAWCVSGGECQSLKGYINGGKPSDKKIMNDFKSYLQAQVLQGRE